MNAHLRATSFWFRLGGALGAVLPVVYAGLWRWRLEPLAWLCIVFCATLGPAFYACGHFLARRRPFARRAGIGLAAIALAWHLIWIASFTLALREAAVHPPAPGFYRSDALVINGCFVATELALAALTAAYFRVLLSKRAIETLAAEPGDPGSLWKSPLGWIPIVVLLMIVGTGYLSLMVPP